MKKAFIVLGSGFGDEGKGVAVDYLSGSSLSNNPVVIRFSGGHQASHTVVHNDVRHIFSSFGSGGLRNVPTFWSKYCPFNPIAAYNEYMDLLPRLRRAMKNSNKTYSGLFVDPEAPVTTPYDAWHNRYQEKRRGAMRHGSVGVGIGATMARHTETHYRLYAQDLQYREVGQLKLQAILDYYLQMYADDLEARKELKALPTHQILASGINSFYSLLRPYKLHSYFNTFIFEGSQGILLDQNYGFFPHVTRSNTTSRNALEIIDQYLPQVSIDIYYTSRAYLTRHGAGPLPGERMLNLTNLETETNQFGDYQGAFRYAEFQPGLLRYALECDQNEIGDRHVTKHLIFSCLDQVLAPRSTAEVLTSQFKAQVDHLWFNNSPSSDTIFSLESGIRENWSQFK